MARRRQRWPLPIPSPPTPPTNKAQTQTEFMGTRSEVRDKDGKKWNIVAYSTASERLRAAMERTGRFNSYNTSRRESRGDDWAGTSTFEEAVNLVQTGWKEGADKTRKLTEQLVAQVSSLVAKETIQYDVTGTDFDMGMYLQGVPECWTRFEPSYEVGNEPRNIRVTFDQAASCSVSTQTMIAKGAAVCALVELLELAGNTVEVELVCTTKTSAYKGDNWLFRAPTKYAGQPLDLDRLVFALAHPASFRRIQFGVLESFDAYINEAGLGYGQPAEMPAEFAGDIHISSSSSEDVQWESPATAVRWVMEELKKQGVNLEAKKR